MPLTAGTRLGPYEILGPLGAGGMGEVYKARDTRLDRTVAIKVLPPALAGDPQFRERFEREARAISALEHPHICPLYDVGHGEGVDYLVMPHLEGETLAQRLERGALPVEDALRYGMEIAAALDRAHSHGIVHRDLKPGNVMLARSGKSAPQAKLLDFGLAKAAGSDPGQTGVRLDSGSRLPVTRTTPLTAQGSIVGTFQYMAPEQLEGQDADTRSDIWAFGCVLYEMLTGQRAFSGKSQASLIGSILKDDPPRLSTVQPLAPTALDHVVRRCLAKDPEDRWQHVRDVRSELAWIADGAASAIAPKRPATRAWLLPAGIVAGVVLGALGAWALWPSRPAAPTHVARFVIQPPAGAPTGLSVGDLAVSPDGARVVFGVGGAAGPLFLRPIDQASASPIRGTEGASEPFFSPDGATLAFFDDGQLKRLSLAGGEPTAIVAAAESRGGTWTRDGRIIFSPRAYGPLHIVDAGGGSDRPLTTLDAARQELSHRYPHALPDGRIVFSILTEDPAAPAVGIVEAGGGPHRVLRQPAMSPQYASGHLLFAEPSAGAGLILGGSVPLVAMRYTNGQIDGEPIPVLGKVAAIEIFGIAHYAVAVDGTLVSGAGPEPPTTRVSWVDRKGTESPLPLPERSYFSARLAGDGRSIALVAVDAEGDLFIADAVRGIAQPLRSSITGVTGAVWSPDGTALAVGGTIDGKSALARLPLATPNAPVRLSLPKTVTRSRPTSWRSDGSAIALDSLSMVTRTDIYLVSPADGALQTVAATQAPENTARFSSDGNWLAYFDANNLFVQRYPGPSLAVQVSPDGAQNNPVWSKDGRELFYKRGRQVMAVPFGPDGPTGPPRMVFEHAGQLHDIAPDGTRFLFLVRTAETPPPPPLIATIGWLDGLLNRRTR